MSLTLNSICLRLSITWNIIGSELFAQGWKKIALMHDFLKIQIFKIFFFFFHSENSEASQRWKDQTRQNSDPVLTLHWNIDFNARVEV